MLFPNRLQLWQFPFRNIFVKLTDANVTLLLIFVLHFEFVVYHGVHVYEGGICQISKLIDFCLVFCQLAEDIWLPVLKPLLKLIQLLIHFCLLRLELLDKLRFYGVAHLFYVSGQLLLILNPLLYFLLKLAFELFDHSIELSIYHIFERN